ncbi:MAG: glycosyl transferase, partial [Flavobacteriaceae bacterium]|nr:glycosyl transferase [Flavobacteriaceae bacterium]
MVAYFQRLQDKYGLEIGRRFEDGSIHSLPQDYADQLGWEELTQITAKAYALIPDKSKALIYAENYVQAGA